MTDGIDLKPTTSELVDQNKIMEAILKIESMENKIKSLPEEKSEETEDTKDLIKSVNELKKEAKAFVTKNGYSKLLGTHIFFKKIFWLVTWFPLFGYCLYLLIDSYKQFMEFNVVTQIKRNSEDEMTFPAITFCLQTLLYNDGNLQFRTLEFSDAFFNCDISQIKPANQYQCSIADFFKFELQPIIQNDFKNKYNCYQFNSGRKADGSANEIFKTPLYGLFTGLSMKLKLSELDFLFYYIGDNQVQPTMFELENTLQSGIHAAISFEKTIETKLPKPYSNCTQNINSEYSEMVKEAIQANFTYRRVNCFNWCMKKLNGSLPDIVHFCMKSCPVECETVSFDVNSNLINLPKTPEFERTLLVNFFYSSNKYTELSQSVRISFTDLISNGGGTLGLFLDFTFLSIVRFVCSLYDILF